MTTSTPMPKRLASFILSFTILASRWRANGFVPHARTLSAVVTPKPSTPHSAGGRGGGGGDVDASHGSAGRSTKARPNLPYSPPTPSLVYVGRIALKNVYDDWRSDAVVDTMHLSEENVVSCLSDLVQSEYGKRMFGVHDLPASVGITGCIDLVEINGPEVVLSLSGKFWHRRETVLGRAAMWLNARMPEVASVAVADPADLEDYEDILDEFGEVLYREDKRSPDFNGDRETMEYQGIDPDVRGPFPQGVGGFRPGGSMINPA